MSADKPRWRLIAATAAHYTFINRRTLGVAAEFYNISRSDFWGCAR